ncbi:hypothetical protein CEXT_100141 [Caerostris extrusa]|uniref:LAGLIDADG homing endonuclease n=1 Tax=Caerostris extrusa TaxID=172846 RepID=A0AAV4N364_CAEEX|nr:hypothetical protein CEXT_100141 [Caerostris extrusa]
MKLRHHNGSRLVLELNVLHGLWTSSNESNLSIKTNRRIANKIDKVRTCEASFRYLAPDKKFHDSKYQFHSRRFELEWCFWNLHGFMDIKN